MKSIASKTVASTGNGCELKIIASRWCNNTISHSLDRIKVEY